MSGIRIHDRRLLEAGLTLPGFVSRSRVIASLPSLGLLTLAAYCPPGWEPTYREVDELPEGAAEAIAGERFDLVALSSFSARIPDAYRLADELRARGVRVVLGGLHVSALPEEARAHADAVVTGEAEPVWAQLLEDAAAGRLKPLYARRARSLWDSPSPVPRYDLLPRGRYDRLTLQTARGCPRHCAFCGASRTISPYRLKPLPQVARELDALLGSHPRAFIELADDDSFAVPGRAAQIAGLLESRGARWFTETDLSIADDPGGLEALARGDCAQLLIGLESASPRSLRGLDRRDWKRRQYDGYLEKIARIQGHGISVNGCFILGLDEDGPESFEETRTFVEASGLAEAQITLQTPFPGTALYSRLEAEGRLPPPPFWEKLTLFDVAFTPLRMNAADLEAGFMELMKTLYAKPAVTRRRKAFAACRRRRGEHVRHPSRA